MRLYSVPAALLAPPGWKALWLSARPARGLFNSFNLPIIKKDKSVVNNCVHQGASCGEEEEKEACLHVMSGGRRAAQQGHHGPLLLRVG
ncbi:hypothetical protein E2C01_028617 [Portunus trituberculatus]|uniref:Uncharacterized protein n=1 Tax=Portunus trituberculatus TaxID=210409 RepID=A0A5B7EPY1_PORTR|nr:hypothetical protein [Portunus trituberculatus]